MSPRSSKPAPQPTVGPDIYVALLVVSLAAVLTGVGFLIAELGKYGWKVAS